MISSQVLEKFLLDTNLVKKDQLDQLRKEAQSQKTDLEDLLLEKSIVSEDQIEAVTKRIKYEIDTH